MFTIIVSLWGTCSTIPQQRKVGDLREKYPAGRWWAALVSNFAAEENVGLAVNSRLSVQLL